VQQASWLIGERSLAGKGITRGIFSLSDPGTAYFNNPFLGDDPGAGHKSDIKKGKNKQSCKIILISMQAYVTGLFIWPLLWLEVLHGKKRDWFGTKLLRWYAIF
jgi:hypothetical protein